MAERLFRLLNIVDSWLFPEKITCLCCDSALGDDERTACAPAAHRRSPDSAAFFKPLRRLPASIRPLPLFPMPTSRVN